MGSNALSFKLLGHTSRVILPNVPKPSQSKVPAQMRREDKVQSETECRIREVNYAPSILSGGRAL